jgi:hypothetical protein
MGVLACNRYDCENIMCDRYSSTYGYICNECFDELVASGKKNIQKFMESNRNSYKNKRDYHYYDDIFKY